MEHIEFTEAYRRGRLAVDVDHSKALQIANTSDGLPNRFRYMHIFWTCAWLSTIPAAVVAAIIYAWWAGALVFAVLMPAMFTAAKMAAARQVIRYAVENSVFYDYVVDHEVIRVRRKV
jgi:hypothetical protein